MSIVSETPPVVQESPPVSKPAGNLTKKAGLNAFSYLIDFTARTVVMLLVTPFLLHGVGRSLYGVWQVLWKTVNYLQAADGRPTDALKWIVVREQANEDHTAKREAIGSAIGVWLLFLPVLLAVGGGLVYAFPFFTEVLPKDVATVRIACGLLVLNFIAMGVMALPEAVLEGMNLRYRRMMARSVISILGGLASAGFVYLGFGLPGLALALVLMSMATAFLAWTIVKAHFKWFGFVKPTWTGTKKFVRLTTAYLGSSIVKKLIVTCDVVTLGVVATPAIVTTYVLSSYAANVLVYVIPAMLNSAVPGLGRFLGDKRHDRVMEIRSEMLHLGWLIMTATGATILAWNRSFINLWVGMDNYAGALGDLMIIALVTQFIFIQSDSAVVDATLRVKVKAALGLVATILGIGLAALLIPKYQILGLCGGLIVGRLVMSVGYPMIIRTYLGESKIPNLGSLVRPGVAMLFLFVGTTYFGQHVLAPNWGLWVLGVMPTMVFATAFAFFIGLAPRHRAFISNRVAALTHRRA